jgi:SAM-dependent methyltransferase
MKLSRLIAYKHMVDSLSVRPVSDEISLLLERIGTDLEIQHVDFDNLKQHISGCSRDIMQNLDYIHSDLLAFKKNLAKFISDVEQPYYEKSRSIYAESIKDSPEYVLDRYNFKKLFYEQEVLDFFSNRVKIQASWKWPAVEIRPAHGEISDNLIACDPLYLVDTHQDMFKNVKNKWTPEYQRRIRYYTLDETHKKIFNQLPHGQIGLLVAVDFFNFRPLELIKTYLQETFSVLRPGGMAIFTYNNCDYPIGVDNFENSYYCYTPGEKVKEICKEIGFMVAASFDLENNVSWLEIQKPGTMSTLRGGQTLGKIITI